jgi:hypothetical protein
LARPEGAMVLLAAFERPRWEAYAHQDLPLEKLVEALFGVSCGFLRFVWNTEAELGTVERSGFSRPC